MISMDLDIFPAMMDIKKIMSFSVEVFVNYNTQEFCLFFVVNWFIIYL